jgi:hypothetical protein
MGYTIESSIPDRGKRFFLFSQNTRPALMFIHPPMNLVRVPFAEIKRPVHYVDHKPPPTVKVKNDCSYTSTLPLRLHGIDRDKFTSYLYVVHLRCTKSCLRTYCSLVNTVPQSFTGPNNFLVPFSGLKHVINKLMRNLSDTDNAA